MSIYNNPLKRLAEYDEMEKDLRLGRGPVQISGLPDGAKAFFVSQLPQPWKLLITYDENRARNLAEDIRCFTGDKEVMLYPARDLLFFSADIRGNVISGQRIDVWRHMSEDDSGVVVTTIDALMDKLEDPDQFRKKTIIITQGEKLSIDELLAKLVDFGYERQAQVENGGQFAVRGGIVDIFPLTEEIPVRIEFWDDEVDSMRSFDILSQRSIETCDIVSIYPAKEIELGGSAGFLRYWDFDRSAIFIDEPARVYDRACNVQIEYNEGMSGRIEAGQLDASEVPDLFGAEEIITDLSTPRTVCLTGLDQIIAEIEPRHIYSVHSKNTSSYKNSFEMLIADMKNYQNLGYEITMLSASRTRSSRLADSLRDYGLRETEVIYGNLHHGFEFPGIKFVVISESDIFGKKKKHRYKKKFDYEGTKVSSLAELHIGDYVVHEEHGLGIYRGIEKIERDHVIKDYMKIEYAGGDNCYLPATKLDIIQKYSGSDGARPKLNKLGGDQWLRTKRTVKKAVAEIARELVTLYSARLKGSGHEYGPDTVWQREFEEMFEFEETEDQIKAIEAVKADMQSGRIMDRLICGDVGYGKTEVALRASFKVIQEGYQVIYLVPTTILAQQHYNTFVQRMKNFPVRVELLSRFRSAAQQKKVLEDFSKGLVDIIIGTHRVLSKDLNPKRLGLLVIDEEQRFGVRHKEKIKELRSEVDVLTLTATPIPRTLHMSLVGIRDLSVLEEPPQDRQPIQTYVMEYNDEIVREAIRREIQRGGQVYYVYNRVSSIQEMTARVQALVPDATVAFAHGQMSERDLERVMLDFINGEIDVLVSTTIIETGLDIPNVNTMIIHDADKLGLSQLYQLRGRVGRSSRTAYAFLLYRKNKLLSEEAEKRLKAIREFTELGSGIRIAMRDLEIRGAGNVLGAEQHGHMEAVGYDLYCKMLNTAVKALKGEDIARDEFDTSVDADTDAFIPAAYIKNEEQKLDIYKRIASIETEDDFMDMQDELMDRFGDIPKPVDNLLRIAQIKSLAHNIFVTDVTIGKQTAVLIMYNKAPIDPTGIPQLIDGYKGALSIRQGDSVSFILNEKRKQINCDEMLTAVRDLLIRMNDELKAKEPQDIGEGNVDEKGEEMP
ncbi:MAG: transcription-repair coupling factor [Lachnospiraceae bacterium]|nr:transcription-repair coupling factor [Lachnospiraceae bacterium]